MNARTMRLMESVVFAKYLEESIDAKADRAQKLISKAETTAIKDPNLLDAVKAFRTVLEYGKEVLGMEAVSNPDVAAELLRGASYVAWRGIMGPKSSEDKKVKMQF